MIGSLLFKYQNMNKRFIMIVIFSVVGLIGYPLIFNIISVVSGMITIYNYISANSSNPSHRNRIQIMLRKLLAPDI